MTVLKDCKSSQENVSLSLAKKKLAEKNEWKFSYQSGEKPCMLPYTSEIAAEVSFFSVTSFRVWIYVS